MLQEIARLRFELTEAECRARAERMARQQSAEWKATLRERLRAEHRGAAKPP